MYQVGALNFSLDTGMAPEGALILSANFVQSLPMAHEGITQNSTEVPEMHAVHGPNGLEPRGASLMKYFRKGMNGW